jgi:hypothetical protein
MLQIEDIRLLCTDDTIVLTEHLLTRMRQRQIRLKDIKYAIENGKIIEQYPTDYPFPSCLIFGENLHIVCSIGEGRLYIITAYRPSPEQWDAEGGIKKEYKP